MDEQDVEDDDAADIARELNADGHGPWMTLLTRAALGGFVGLLLLGWGTVNPDLPFSPLLALIGGAAAAAGFLLCVAAVVIAVAQSER